SILPVTLRAYPVSTLFPYTTLFRSDNDVRFSGDDWRDEPGDVGAFVLSVGIGVDDDVRARGESRVDSAAEGGGEAPVAAMAHDVLHAPPASDLGGGVRAPIVDHEEFDRVDAVDPPGQGGDGVGKGASFVETRNLDDQLGHDAPQGGRPRGALP